MMRGNGAGNIRDSGSPEIAGVSTSRTITAAPLAQARVAGAADSRADANEYTQITRNSSNQNPAHDKNGNMTSLPTRPATGAAAGTNVSTAITFDAFNRPFTAQAGGNGVQDYRYDALGRRIAAMELSGGNILAGRRFVWDSWSVATERLLSGTTGNCDSLLERCYVEGASLDEHLFAAIDGDLDGSLSTNLNVPVSASTTNTNDYLYYYLPNRLGSVMGLLNATDDRFMLEYYRYTIYGEATVLPLYDTGLNQIEDTPTDLSDNNTAMLATRTGGGGDATAGRASTFNNQYTFTGRYLDAETGLHYFRFRYYESRTGRFISRDPAETPWENLYSYCENSPTEWTDPEGLRRKPGISNPRWNTDPIRRHLDRLNEQQRQQQERFKRQQRDKENEAAIQRFRDYLARLNDLVRQWEIRERKRNTPNVIDPESVQRGSESPEKRTVSTGAGLTEAGSKKSESESKSAVDGIEECGPQPPPSQWRANFDPKKLVGPRITRRYCKDSCIEQANGPWIPKCLAQWCEQICADYPDN